MHKRKQELLINAIEALATREKLFITERQQWRNRILGMDRINKMLVLVWMNEGVMEEHLIPINEINYCNVFQKTSGKSHIQAILLELTFRSKQLSPLQIPFYEEIHDGIFEMKRLAERAEYWKKALNN
ncbi:hypothetical protein DN068_02215 [Taibaiella soli]|uniref:Uncharacterized protein n=2 Tax=Taibaiella soli TaxID=1649169 RepID=A0A2W2AFX3_9BACT|nr:hypothetical protein DN068_02215 [Taibaiella soli]